MLRPIIFLAVLTSCTWIQQHPTEVKLAEDIAEEVAEVAVKDMAKGS